MVASFSNTAPDSCQCCEYRQYLKGQFRMRRPPGAWTTVPLLLRFGVPINLNTFNEDGFPGGAAYGYRAFNGCQDIFIPNRANGCTYIGHDFPGFRNLTAGDEYDIDLIFKGEIVDVCNPDPAGRPTVRFSAQWVVHCQGVA